MDEELNQYQLALIEVNTLGLIKQKVGDRWTDELEEQLQSARTMLKLAFWSLYGDDDDGI